MVRPNWHPAGVGVLLPAVDWFHNNVIDPGTVAVDINGDGAAEIGANALRGFNDWPAVVLDGGGRIGSCAARGQVGVPGTNPMEVSRDELESLIPPEVRQRMDCSVEEIVTVTPESGGNAPLTVTFDASASTAPCGTIASYSWDFGDGNFDNGAIVTHVYVNSGEYVANLSLTDNNGNINYVQLDYVVVVNPAGTCTYSISSTNQSFAANGGNGSVAVSAPGGCNWNATNNDTWISITSGGGPGDGTVTYSVAANTATSSRSGTMTIAGLTFTVVQGAGFLDVPESSPFYTFIGKLSARGVTQGCGGGNYCPNDPVTREQMAAFIIRARGEFSPPTPGSQRFDDVPPSNPFYNFIDRMAVLQITLGCGANPPLYCPSNPVLREQMAAFIIRGIGEFNPPTPGSQRFTDVPPANPFYNFIDRMAVLQITFGCTPTMYCPSDIVTRGAMAAFLVRAFNL